MMGMAWDMPSAGSTGRSGGAREVRSRLAAQRPRSALLRLHAALFSEGGALGRAARRRGVRFAIRSIPALVAVALAALLVERAFSGATLGWPQVAALAVLLATLIGVSWRRAVRALAAKPAGIREQVEIGSLFVIAAYTLAQASAGEAGGLDGPLYPIVYLVLGCLVALLPGGVALALVVSALGIETLVVWHLGSETFPSSRVAAHAGFIVLFSSLYRTVLAARMALAGRAERAAVEHRLSQIQERAREFRLLSPVSTGQETVGEQGQRWTEASVLEVETAVHGALEVAEVALDAHTCALFLLTSDDAKLVLRDCRSRSEQVARQPIPAGEGALGAVVRRNAPLRLNGDIRNAGYYQDGTRPRAFAAVPLVDRRGGNVRGVLLADRIEARPFTEADERLLYVLAGELLRAIAGERLLTEMKRTRDEKERFYGAIERLNRTTKPLEVFDALLQMAAERVPIEFGAVTMVEPSGGKTYHRIARLLPGNEAKNAAALEGFRFLDNSGLVASAVRLGSSLPGKELKIGDAVIFDNATRLKGLHSLKIVPLKTGETVLGTLVLGARREAVFDSDAVREIEVVSMQAAESVLRARLFEQAERLAITDGLTGLLNHRTFQGRFEEHLAQAVRYGKKLALVLCDIDHFKSVNDTYGHPVGDRVLKGVAKVLTREARTTDLVARYGGEEFAIIMPETDAAGALATAERIRERLGRTSFDSDLGPFHVTLSLGIAACPEDGRKRAELIELADACLYHAKRHGRNRSVPARALKAAQRVAS